MTARSRAYLVGRGRLAALCDRNGGVSGRGAAISRRLLTRFQNNFGSWRFHVGVAGGFTFRSRRDVSVTTAGSRAFERAAGCNWPMTSERMRAFGRYGDLYFQIRACWNFLRRFLRWCDFCRCEVTGRCVRAARDIQGLSAVHHSRVELP